MVSTGQNLGQTAAAYIASLSPSERSAVRAEVNLFVRWYGADRPISKLAPHDVEQYVQYVEATGAPPAQRLEPVRAFLIYVRKEGLATENLAPHVRIRRQLVKKSQTKTPIGDEPAIEMTAEGHAQLQTELADLISQRPLIADELARARADKDFRENAPLDAAREHQAQVESRIRELQATLRVATVVDEEVRSDTSRASIGSVVVVRDLEDDSKMTFTLVSPSEVDLKRGRISVASPLGRAMVDREPGDEIAVDAPVGILQYRIEEILDR